MPSPIDDLRAKFDALKAEIAVLRTERDEARAERDTARAELASVYVVQADTVGALVASVSGVLDELTQEREPLISRPTLVGAGQEVRAEPSIATG